MYIYPRVDGADKTLFRVNKDWAQVFKPNGAGGWTQLGSNVAVTTTQGDVYRVRVVSDGNTMKEYRAAKGEVEIELFDVTDAGLNLVAQDKVEFLAAKTGSYLIDNVRILADDLSRTTTMVFNSANELLTSADYNGTISYVYDDSGRTTSKTRGTDVATYSWGYGNFLLQVDSDFPDEGLVDYAYGGDMSRRSRDDGTEFTWFNWAGGTPINEEAQGVGVGDGALTNTYIGKLAELGGSNPGTGSESYYMMDHLGSVRGIFDGADAMTGLAEFSPFGSPIVAQLPAGFDPRYTVHHLDSASGLYYAPFRYLDPATGRWIKRDPYGMVDGPNMFVYLGGNPIGNTDPSGLRSSIFIPGPNGGSSEGSPTPYPSGGNIPDPYSPWDMGIYSGVKSAYGAAATLAFCSVPAAAAGRVYGPQTRESVKKIPKFIEKTRRYFRYDPPHHGKPAGFDGIIPNWIRKFLKDIGM